jgi:enoyl-CoA hydratase/carnithine racemase
MTEPRVLTERDDGVLLATLNRPERKNAFDDPLWNGLRETLDQARTDRSVAVVLLTGAGGNFSSGQDLNAFPTDGAEPDDDGSVIGSIEDTAFSRFVDSLVAFDKPLVAAATGIAVGGGATILFHADILYVGEGLRMRLPFANLGLVPELASSYTLQHAIGSQRAAELFYTAEWIDAERAVDVGIAAASFPDDDLLAAARSKAAEIAHWPVASLQATKRCLMAAHTEGIARARAIENETMMERAGSPENIEAIVAFLEKRDPDFTQFREG